MVWQVALSKNGHSISHPTGFLSMWLQGASCGEVGTVFPARESGQAAITAEVKSRDAEAEVILGHKRQQPVPGSFEIFVLGTQPPSHEEVQTAHKMKN